MTKKKVMLGLHSFFGISWSHQWSEHIELEATLKMWEGFRLKLRQETVLLAKIDELALWYLNFDASYFTGLRPVHSFIYK